MINFEEISEMNDYKRKDPKLSSVLNEILMDLETDQSSGFYDHTVSRAAVEELLREVYRRVVRDEHS